MRKSFLLVTFLCCNSYGQVWDHVVNSSSTEYYLDRNSIRPNGSFISYSQMSNYLDEYKYNKQIIRSIVQSRLSDCVENKFKTIGMIGYSEFDGRGNVVVVNSTPDRDWVVINMDKITGEIQREVCK